MPGLGGKHELPHLESLIESHSGRPHEVYRVLKFAVPLAIVAFGVASIGFAMVSRVGPVQIVVGALATALLAGVSGQIFHRLDQGISQDSRRLRKQADKLLARHLSIGNLVGAEPVLHPKVGEILDEAAAIYLKHNQADRPNDTSPYAQARQKACRALEAAMARLMELAEPVGATLQERLLAAGWAEPVLEEMRALDRALDEVTRRESVQEMVQTDSAIGALQDARLSLQGFQSAVQELEEHIQVEDGRRDEGY